MDERLLPERPPFLPEEFGTVGHQGFIEIIAPEPAPFEPRTVGWYLLGGLVLIGLGFSLLRLVRSYRRNQYRRLSLRELRALSAQMSRDRMATLPKLPLLLKRVALAVYPRERVAKLSGEPWFAFLEEQAPGAISPAGKDALLQILRGTLGDVPASVDHELFESIRRWVRRHRGEEPSARA